MEGLIFGILRYLSNILRTNSMWPSLNDRIHEFKMFIPFVLKYNRLSCKCFTSLIFICK